MDSNQQDIEKVTKENEGNSRTQQVVAEDDMNQDFEKETVLENTATVPSEIRKETPEIRYAGFWMRFWAYLLDIIVIGSINGILVYPIFRGMDLPIHNPSMFAPVSIVTACIFYAYFVFMTKFFSQTLGKMVFGLKVISLRDKKLSWSAIMFREWIGRFISGAVLILYLVVGFLPKKQGIHDLFADTTVVHER